MTKTFLDHFPDHVYRYIDQTGNGRPPVSSVEKRPDLNTIGYEAYFTVNGFKGSANAQKESCTSINAFFVDIDGRKDPEELEKIEKILDPTFILETKNGHHIYWLLDEPIFKDEVENWEDLVSSWERIEQNIVSTLKSDPVVKDITRILRQPDTFYWKKSKDEYKNGTKGVFKIKGVYKKPANTYSMNQVLEAFPPVVTKEEVLLPTNKKYAEAERNDFFERVNTRYPMAERPSFIALISGKAGTVPPSNRNNALIVTASLMKQAGWNREQAIAHIGKVGWHGIEKEPNGMQEIVNTINSGFNNGYTYSPKHEVIAHNTTPDEDIKMQMAFTGVFKDKKASDQIRYTTYEKEVLLRYPHLKKNEVGIIFDYRDGVYRILTDQQISGIMLTCLEEDMLIGFRTTKHVKDKVACLLSIIPDLELTDDKGEIVNLRNGLLNIYTRELKPHTPEFVSLIQFPVLYESKAECPIWESCMEAWMEGDEKEKKITLLKQYAGYCLSSTMNFDRALFLVGDGGNGKSTFVESIARVIGKDATTHIDLEDLYGQFGMIGLLGQRLNVIEEVHGNYYQSNKLKKLISGEKVTVNVKYKGQFTFVPQAKFIFAVNTMPRVDDTSTATERRMCAVVFKNNFRAFPNTSLRSERGLLAQESSGILNWMLEGAKSLKEMKTFVNTMEQTELLGEYRQENSSVEGFIAECLDYRDGVTIDIRELYDTYKEWCQADGRKFKANIAFTKEMKAYGTRYGKFTYHGRKFGGDNAKFEGVCINDDWGKRSVTHQYNEL